MRSSGVFLVILAGLIWLWPRPVWVLLETFGVVGQGNGISDLWWVSKIWSLPSWLGIAGVILFAAGSMAPRRKRRPRRRRRHHTLSPISTHGDEP
jgi:hypothetical protein